MGADYTKPPFEGQAGASVRDKERGMLVYFLVIPLLTCHFYT